MLGLRQKIGGDPVGIAVLVGDDQHLGRPGDHVDADLAEHHALGRRHIGVAGPDDLGDRRDRLRAIGERRDRLCAADAKNFVDAGEFRRRQHQRIEFAAGRRHHHRDARHAGDLGRHGVHQHRRRIGGGAARHIKPDRLDRRPARAELDAERIGKAIVLRHLPAVIGLDAARGRVRARRARRGCTLCTAAAISCAVTFIPARSRSSLSNLSVYSFSARSPRAATSATMPRTAASTSAEASRLVSRNARNFCAKSPERMSRRMAMSADLSCSAAARKLDCALSSSPPTL